MSTTTAEQVTETTQTNLGNMSSTNQNNNHLHFKMFTSSKKQPNKEMPLHISNVSLYNPATKKGDRVGFKLLDDGKKVRVFKSNGEVVGA